MTSKIFLTYQKRQTGRLKDVQKYFWGLVKEREKTGCMNDDENKQKLVNFI